MSRVHISRLINVAPEQAWKYVRDFNSLPLWHPFISTSRIEDGIDSTTVGCIRNFQLKEGGATIREQLLALSDVERLCTYSILEAPITVTNYIATLRLFSITESGQTVGQWRADFDSPEADLQANVDSVSSIFQEGLKGLEEFLTA